jgi:hypothetical protein
MKVQLSLALLLQELLLRCLVLLPGGRGRLAEIEVKAVLLLGGGGALEEGIGIKLGVEFDALAIVGDRHDEVQFVGGGGVDDLEELNDVRMVQLLHDLYFLVDVVQSCREVLQETLPTARGLRRRKAL